MRLVYCKQCNRLISEDEIDSGEAYISKDGAWCNTCAIGLGFDVAVKAAEPRRRGRASRMRTPPARRSAAGPLIALIGAILIGVGITTFLYVFLSRPGDGESAPPPAGGGPTEAPPPAPGPAKERPVEAEGPEKGKSEPKVAKPKILSPEEIRAKARAEFERLRQRAVKLEGEGLLVEAIKAYAGYPFEYRHTEYHDKASAERERLGAECERRFEQVDAQLEAGLAGARGPMASMPALLKVGREIARASRQIGSPSVALKIEERREQAGRRLAAFMGTDLAKREGDALLPTTALLWQPGRRAKLTQKPAKAGSVLEVTFGAEESGRYLEVRLPRGVAWDLSGFGAVSFVIPDCPARATFILGAAAGGAKSAVVCEVEEEGVYRAGLNALALDLSEVTRLTLTLAEPVGRDVKVGITKVLLSKK